MSVPPLSPSLMALALLVGTPAVAQSSSTRQEARDAETRASRCEEELERLSTMQTGPDGLLGMREAGLLDEAGVSVQALLPKQGFTQSPEESPRVQQATTYRARRRIALELKVVNTGTEPFRVARAELVSQGGARLRVLRVLQPEPLLPGRMWQRLAIEADWEGELPPGPYMLELWDADGQRRVALLGMTFP